jgi:hypothetical protein
MRRRKLNRAIIYAKAAKVVLLRLPYAACTWGHVAPPAGVPPALVCV